VCCSVLQCVAVCCSVLHVLQFVAVLISLHGRRMGASETEVCYSAAV